MAYVHGQSMEGFLFVGEGRCGTRLHTPLFSLRLQEKARPRYDYIEVEQFSLKGEERAKQRNQDRTPFSVERGSLFIGGRPPRSSRGNLAFESFSRGRLRVDCFNFPTLKSKQKRKIRPINRPNPR